MKSQIMIDAAMYLRDPCSTLSIPYWKAKETAVPSHMKIVHAQEFCKEDYKSYRDEPYFRLKHDLTTLSTAIIPCGYRLCDASPNDFAAHINSCYEHIGISTEELETYTRRRVYDQSLWLMIKEISSDTIVASGIAELDPECGEGILEWIQVSKHHRHRGLGTYLVSELLHRMKGKASFATVSGQCNNPYNPEQLYRKCGFTGNDVWHILTLK